MDRGWSELCQKQQGWIWPRIFNEWCVGHRGERDTQEWRQQAAYFGEISLEGDLGTRQRSKQTDGQRRTKELPGGLETLRTTVSLSIPSHVGAKH